MAHAKLHIICGNCGCNHMFEYSVREEIDDDDGSPYMVVYIYCNNCHTTHDLEDNAKANELNKKRT